MIVIKIDLPLLLNHKNIFALDRKYFLSIKQAGYRYNRLAIDRTGWLSREEIGHRKNRLAIVRTDWISIELVDY